MQGIYDANQGHQNNLTIAYENALALLKDTAIFKDSLTKVLEVAKDVLNQKN